MAPEDPKDDEPRAIDIVRAAGSADEEHLDAATIAQLSAWFSSPAAPPPTPRREPVEEDEELRLFLERRQRAIDAVDPAFLARRLEIVSAGDALRTALTPPPPLAPIHQFDIEAWRLPSQVDETREVDVPELLKDDLKICAPQAVLRDLHRVVTHFEKELYISDVDLEFAEELRAQLHGERVAARDVMRTSYYIDPTGDRTQHHLQKTRAELRAILTGPWEQVQSVKMAALTDEEALAVARWFAPR